MGPSCPKCLSQVEWCEGEVTEVIVAPKLYVCQFCYEIFTVDIETLKAHQETAKAILGDDSPMVETEEDWKRAREEWDQRI
jgi:hypothetical protein